MSTSMQRLAPKFDEFQQRIKDAKDEQNKTIASLSESSGVPYSAVAKLCAGTQADPKLYNAVALCDDLGLSLDRMFSLTPTGDIDKAERRVHELEIENAALKATAAAHKEQMRSTVWNTRILALICIMLSASLIVYLFIDSQIKHAGLIRNGTLSLEAWLFIALIAVAIATATTIVIRSIQAMRRERSGK